MVVVSGGGGGGDGKGGGGGRAASSTAHPPPSPASRRPGQYQARMLHHKLSPQLNKSPADGLAAGPRRLSSTRVSSAPRICALERFVSTPEEVELSSAGSGTQLCNEPKNLMRQARVSPKAIFLFHQMGPRLADKNLPVPLPEHMTYISP